jgi:cell division transport system ATP-binding protein
MTSWFKTKLGGRFRLSTLVLIAAFVALFWLQQSVQPEPAPEAPVPAVVPPGFVPDPNYTWVPRTQVRRPKEPVYTTTTTAPTTTTTTETTTPAPQDTTTSPTSPSPTTTVVDPDGPGGPLGPQTLIQTPTVTAPPATPAPGAVPATPEAPRYLGGACLVPPLHWRAVMITLDNVSKLYKSSARPALDNVSLSIDKGEFVFLIGPSGSGKSTFMRLLLAEDSPTKGDVRVSKFHVNKLPGRHVPSLRQIIGCVFQDFRLLQQKSVFENVAFALEVIGKRRDVINRVVPDVLEMVGLSGKANRLPGELSGGEQQRVAIARAFVNRPLVLLADEPTGNLDPETSKDIMDLLERINRTGTTVLMATHDHHIVDSMRQRVVELSLGRLVRDEQRGIYGMDR